jgi:hypothetical protein
MSYWSILFRLIAKKLKPRQLAEAQRLATEFQPQPEAAKQ